MAGEWRVDSAPASRPPPPPRGGRGPARRPRGGTRPPPRRATARPTRPATSWPRRANRPRSSPWPVDARPEPPGIDGPRRPPCGGRQYEAQHDEQEPPTHQTLPTNHSDSRPTSHRAIHDRRAAGRGRLPMDGATRRHRIQAVTSTRNPAANPRQSSAIGAVANRGGAAGFGAQGSDPRPSPLPFLFMPREPVPWNPKTLSPSPLPRSSIPAALTSELTASGPLVPVPWPPSPPGWRWRPRSSRVGAKGHRQGMDGPVVRSPGRPAAGRGRDPRRRAGRRGDGRGRRASPGLAGGLATPFSRRECGSGGPGTAAWFGGRGRGRLWGDPARRADPRQRSR